MSANRAPFPADLAGARLDDAVEDLHQRRLAGSVLSEKRVDLTRLDRKIDPVERSYFALSFKCLGDTPQEDHYLL